ncbi:MAG: L-2-amino-thiazoline-4-carboxylic acid hydrolase, partial [Candidatus Competibacteraceae bacterium]|nr:L-2-amino-thiazoline-4-carboxylic acid hydrolase [Candidatus Competibacteraceae bacterium]
DEEVELFCDIAMDGDRGRAAYHGLELELGETLAKGNGFCRLHLSGGSDDPRHTTEE